MNINPMNFNKSYFDVYRKNYQNSVEAKEQIDLQNQINHIKDYESSELGMKEKEDFNRHVDYEFILRRSLYSDDGPVIGIMGKYNEFLDNINKTFEDENERKREIKSLDRAYEGAIGLYAVEQTMLLKWVGYNKYNMTSEFKRIKSIDDQTAKNIQKDIIHMFRNTKNYYAKNGSLNGISESIITGNSQTLNYKDLILFDKTRAMMHIFIFNEFNHFTDDKTFIKRGEKLVERIQDSEHSDYMKKILRDILLLKY